MPVICIPITRLEKSPSSTSSRVCGLELLFDPCSLPNPRLVQSSTRCFSSASSLQAGCLWPLASQDGGGRKWRFLNYEQTNQGSPVKKRKYGRIWCDVGDDLW
ncbi:Uncharacterized protein HZ326_10932 [Fusarium oxysporum f. sp. albedinis]|nr:Uncharacterized protein HZ326_10932 [Fusarium oxysporum f. sp. albedinis]